MKKIILIIIALIMLCTTIPVYAGWYDGGQSSGTSGGNGVVGGYNQELQGLRVSLKRYDTRANFWSTYFAIFIDLWNTMPQVEEQNYGALTRSGTTKIDGSGTVLMSTFSAVELANQYPTYWNNGIVPNGDAIKAYMMSESGKGTNGALTNAEYLALKVGKLILDELKRTNRLGHGQDTDAEVERLMTKLKSDIASGELKLFLEPIACYSIVPQNRAVPVIASGKTVKPYGPVAGSSRDMIHFTQEANDSYEKKYKDPNKTYETLGNAYPYLDNPDVNGAKDPYQSVGGQMGTVTFIGMPNSMITQQLNGNIRYPVATAGNILRGTANDYIAPTIADNVNMGWALHIAEMGGGNSIATHNGASSVMPGFDVASNSAAHEFDTANIVKIYEDKAGKHIETFVQEDVPLKIQITANEGLYQVEEWKVVPNSPTTPPMVDGTTSGTKWSDVDPLRACADGEGVKPTTNEVLTVHPEDTLYIKLRNSILAKTSNGAPTTPHEAPPHNHATLTPNSCTNTIVKVYTTTDESDNATVPVTVEVKIASNECKAIQIVHEPGWNIEDVRLGTNTQTGVTGWGDVINIASDTASNTPGSIVSLGTHNVLYEHLTKKINSSSGLSLSESRITKKINQDTPDWLTTSGLGFKWAYGSLTGTCDILITPTGTGNNPGEGKCVCGAFGCEPGKTCTNRPSANNPTGHEFRGSHVHLNCPNAPLPAVKCDKKYSLHNSSSDHTFKAVVDIYSISDTLFGTNAGTDKFQTKIKDNTSSTKTAELGGDKNDSIPFKISSILTRTGATTATGQDNPTRLSSTPPGEKNDVTPIPGLTVADGTLSTGRYIYKPAEIKKLEAKVKFVATADGAKNSNNEVADLKLKSTCELHAQKEVTQTLSVNLLSSEIKGDATISYFYSSTNMNSQGAGLSARNKSGNSKINFKVYDEQEATFVPYYAMTYQTIDDAEDKFNTALINASHTSKIKLGNSFEYSWSAAGVDRPNMLLSSAQFTKHAKAGLIPEMKGKVLPGGALYTLEKDKSNSNGVGTISFKGYYTRLGAETAAQWTTKPATDDSGAYKQAFADMLTDSTKKISDTYKLVQVTEDYVAGGLPNIALPNGGTVHDLKSLGAKYKLEFVAPNASKDRTDISNLTATNSGVNETVYKIKADTSGNIWLGGSIVLTKGQTEEVLSGTAKTINSRTGIFTELLKVLNRDLGTDKSAPWAKADGKWYNEAIQGIEVVMYTGSVSVSLGADTSKSSVRSSAIDPKLTPVNSGKADLFSKYKKSLFRSEGSGAIGTLQTKNQVTIDIGNGANTLLVSNQIYLPNATVQDLGTM